MKISWLCFVLGAGWGLQAEEYAAEPWQPEYAPPQWQSLICLPEDDSKTLVDHEGTLLYDHGQGGGEFATRVTLSANAALVWQEQQLLSPRVPIVRTQWRADALTMTQEAFALRGQELQLPQAVMADCTATQRLDAIIVDFHNTGTSALTLQPTATVFNVYGVLKDDQQLAIKNGARVVLSSAPVGELTRRRGYYSIPLEPLTLPAGGRASVGLVYGTAVPATISVAALRQARARMLAYWQVQPLPYGKVSVPDVRVQALLDSSIRNIWQIREKRAGRTLFQPGATCYRGLWIVDGAFMAEMATLLGRVTEARETLAGLLAHQQADGGIQLVENYHKENGILLWAFCQHARLTNDPSWLRRYWPQLQRVAAHIQTLRAESRQEAAALNFGLLPPGLPDGGQWQLAPEYSNVLWSLSGLRILSETAQWLGETDAAQRWQAEYEDFMRTFRQAAARDQRRDVAGNPYLANYMGELADKDLPQRGLWSFCLAVYPGRLFSADDALMRGTLALLESTERQGMVVGSGWHASGIWSYFASFYAHAWLWCGEAHKAAALLQAFAEHAAPNLAWCEEHSLRGEKHKKIGDMPHAWSAAEFIRLVIHLLALERGDELHLFAGLPADWCTPGMTTHLEGIATYFGQLDAMLEVTAAGEVWLSVKPLAGLSGTNLVVHTTGWQGAAAVPLRFEGGRGIERHRIATRVAP